MINLEKHFNKLNNSNFHELFSSIINNGLFKYDKIPFFINLDTNEFLLEKDITQPNTLVSVLYIGSFTKIYNKKFYKNFLNHLPYEDDFKNHCLTLINKVQAKTVKFIPQKSDFNKYPIDFFNLDKIFDYSTEYSYINNIQIYDIKTNMNYLTDFLYRNKKDILLILNKQKSTNIFKNRLLLLAALLLFNDNELVALVQNKYKDTTFSNVELDCIINTLLILPKNDKYKSFLNHFIHKLLVLDIQYNIKVDNLEDLISYLIIRKLEPLFDKYDSLHFDFLALTAEPSIYNYFSPLDEAHQIINNKYTENYYIPYSWLVTCQQFEDDILSSLLSNKITLIIEKYTYDTLKLMYDNDINPSLIKDRYLKILELKKEGLLKFFK